MIQKVHILLPDIRSAHNVGSIFRSADCFGIEKVYLTGTTPRPIDRFGRSHIGPQKEIAKTALGAEKTVVWEYVEDGVSILKKLKKENFHIVAIEQDKKSIDLKDFKKEIKAENILLVFGNEVSGVDKSMLKKVDTIVELPMRGDKESLNVAVCAGIVMYKVSGFRYS